MNPCNQTIFSWMNKKLEVRKTEETGHGVYAKETIKKDERLAIFGGYIMLVDEIKNLPTEFQIYPLQITEDLVIGMRQPTQTESSDYFNHSCEPNAGVRGQILLVAMDDIEKDVEVTFDYAMVISESPNSDMVFSMECKCGKANCRKQITEDDWKSPSLQQKYDGYFSQYLQELIDKTKSRMV